MRQSAAGFPLIESIQNPKIKSALELRESRARRQRGEFIIEGRRELARALDSEVVISDVFVGEEFLGQAEASNLMGRLTKTTRLTRVSKRVYDKLALREGTEGFIAIGQNQSWQDTECFNSASVLVIMDGLEKPGNIGAVLRSMDGSGATAMLISSDVPVDIYNPNTIRASQGAIFSLPVKIMASSEIVAALNKNRIRSYALHPDAAAHYFDAKLNSACAIIVGNEANGLSEFWRQSADELLKIPMKGICDSLNASVATAVVLYEVLRQRK